ncbi:LysE family translocator [Magnetospirillum aberrantis]|uniref:LysE family translocator n=1 Tax=Magnetospirillum aberrantis SpK TaxID=908842 RepID=A0A7C9UX81_9PROT|nr:LysE family translocator [Magnetospirillum aberrantis]NFV78955.1 LysE family translocator [Magnetospirillum aberrantis SpK]
MDHGALLGLGQVLTFLGAAVAVTLAPGPDNLMVLSLGAARGPKAGMAFGIGCGVGCLSHTALAAAGVSALIAASPTAFLTLKLAGGLYLIWLGIQVLRHPAMDKAPAAMTGDARALFLRGVLANAVNPKVIVFFLAFLPQFVVVERGQTALQTLVLGTLFALQAAGLFALVGLFAGHLGQSLSRHPAAGRWLNRLAGATFVGIGAKLALGR